jgi:hypothetical protein
MHISIGTALVLFIIWLICRESPQFMRVLIVGLVLFLFLLVVGAVRVVYVTNHPELFP